MTPFWEFFYAKIIWYTKNTFRKSSPKSAGTKGVLAFATPNPSPKAPSPSAARNSNISVAPKPDLLTPFQGLIEEWLIYCKAGGLSPKTLITYRDFVSKLYWCWAEYAHKGRDNGKEPHPADVTTKDVREFAAYLRTPLAVRWGVPVPPRVQTLSPFTVSSYGHQIKVFFNWLEQEEYIDHTPINRSVKFTNKSKQDAYFVWLEERAGRVLLIYFKIIRWKS